MYIIAGLGNPDKKYLTTRHNIGFMTIDTIASKYGIRVEEEKHRALIGKGIIEGNKVILVKPLTYMNSSGEALRALCDYYKIDAESELIVIYDDISLPVGQLRIRPKGSAGGHNGIKSIIAQLSTEKFMRIKIGVGEKPARMDLADYVLGNFSKEDMEKEKEAYDKATNAVTLIMNDEVEKAMNIYNTKLE